MTPKPFRIFRAGTHTDSAGQVTTFTPEQLAATVAAYNEGAWRAPIVVGHPKGHAPAYGWVSKLELNDQGEIVAETEKLNPDFAELMKAGAYRNRSASLYAPDHPQNPTPGVWQLRHLGVLGAQPPALKGLGDVEFHDDDNGVTVDFADYTTSTIGSIFRKLRDTLISKWGVEEADKALPSFLVEDIEAAGRQSIEADATSPAYSETQETTMTPEQIAALQAKADQATQLQAELDAANARATTAEQAVQSFSEQQATAARAAALVEAKGVLAPLVQAGKLLPAQLDKAAEFMAGLDNTTPTFDFGEATGDKALTQRAFFHAILDAQPKAIEYGEVSGDPITGPSASLSGNDLGTKAREYQEAMGAKGVVITATQAVDAVIAGKTAA